MAPRLVFRSAAQADLDALDNYIAQDSSRQAAAFVRKIIERCASAVAQSWAAGCWVLDERFVRLIRDPPDAGPSVALVGSVMRDNCVTAYARLARMSSRLRSGNPGGSHPP